MKKQLIESQLKGIKCYGVTYSEMKIVLDELISNEEKRKKSNKYTIDYEGDFVFCGDFKSVETFIKEKLVNIKNWDKLKLYGLTTPTEEDVILVRSDEFGHLFN